MRRGAILNGNSIGTDDLSMMKSALLGTVTLTELQFLRADTDANGELGTDDIGNLKSYSIGSLDELPGSYYIYLLFLGSNGLTLTDGQTGDFNVKSTDAYIGKLLNSPSLIDAIYLFQDKYYDASGAHDYTGNNITNDLDLEVDYESGNIGLIAKTEIFAKKYISTLFFSNLVQIDSINYNNININSDDSGTDVSGTDVSGSYSYSINEIEINEDGAKVYQLFNVITDWSNTDDVKNQLIQLNDSSGGEAVQIISGITVNTSNSVGDYYDYSSVSFTYTFDYPSFFFLT
mgnify:CR=1 FL=1